jgi:hypothetical protein
MASLTHCPIRKCSLVPSDIGANCVTAKQHQTIVSAITKPQSLFHSAATNGALFSTCSVGSVYPRPRYNTHGLKTTSDHSIEYQPT